MAINIGQLTQKNVGDWVQYHGGMEIERGRLKSWNETTVFVVFKCDGDWDRFREFTGQSTNPRDLTFESKEARRDNCGDHYYLQHGKYALGVKCQFCGDEKGTTF